MNRRVAKASSGLIPRPFFITFQYVYEHLKDKETTIFFNKQILPTLIFIQNRQQAKTQVRTELLTSETTCVSI